MAAPISLDTSGRGLTDKNVIKPKSMQIGYEKMGINTLPKSEDYSAEVQENTTINKKSGFTESLNRRIDYHIQQENDEIIIKVRNGETGEVIRQIPQEEFVRLMDRISEFTKKLLDETV